MTDLAIVGGVYWERCVSPFWNEIYGSGGRAAVALADHCSLTLYTYANAETDILLRCYGDQFGFSSVTSAVDALVTFDYSHPLAVPVIYPDRRALQIHDPISVRGEVVLRFGMLEGSAIVDADTCVYDPQDQIRPEPFHANGSEARRHAVVANEREIQKLTGVRGAAEGAKKLVTEGADCVVVKSGVAGATVVDGSGSTIVGAYVTGRVWPIGSGDVFAAGFAWWWGVGESPQEAARLASIGTAAYADSRALPLPSRNLLETTGLPLAIASRSEVYLAGPFFDAGQRWVVDEARRALYGMGQRVFSPIHDVGSGAGSDVAPLDLEAITKCDVMFAIASGMDPGTLFEIGYARAEGKPVYVLAQGVKPEDLKMIEGSGCKVFNDLTTALYHTAWRS